MCKYYSLLGKLLYGKIFLIIFDQHFIAQILLPNMKEKTVKIIQLLGFGGHFQMMFNFPEIVPRNVYNCTTCDNILGHQGGGGDTASQDKNLLEIWCWNKNLDTYKVEFHTQKSRILVKLLPEFQTWNNNLLRVMQYNLGRSCPFFSVVSLFSVIFLNFLPKLPNFSVASLFSVIFLNFLPKICPNFWLPNFLGGTVPPPPPLRLLRLCVIYKQRAAYLLSIGTILHHVCHAWPSTLPLKMTIQCHIPLFASFGNWGGRPQWMLSLIFQMDACLGIKHDTLILHLKVWVIVASYQNLLW